jgi:OmpA-OmpF porin, OOP family
LTSTKLYLVHIKKIQRGYTVMKSFVATVALAAAALFASGCATKKYVRNTVAPIHTKVDQVAEQANKNSQSIDETRAQVKDVDERAQIGIDAARERALSADQRAQAADQHARDAADAANQASQTAVANRQDIAKLRGAIENIDDYKLQGSVSVSFGFDKDVLSKDARQKLDKVAGEAKEDKRFFLAVEGHTDKTGSQEHNEALSRRRADKVVEYLVAQGGIPVYRIHMVGLGAQKLIDEGRGRAANARNRRVDVRVFSADGITASLSAISSITGGDVVGAGEPNQ